MDDWSTYDKAQRNFPAAYLFIVNNNENINVSDLIWYSHRKEIVSNGSKSYAFICIFYFNYICLYFIISK